MKKMLSFLDNLKKTFLRKKIQLQVSKSGVFWERKCSAKIFKLRSQLVHSEVIHDISAKNFKNFLKWKKNPTSSFKIGGIYWQKKSKSPKPLKVPSLARSVPKPLKVPSLAL